MTRRLAVVCALVLASSGSASAARGRGKPRARKPVQAAPVDHAGTHPATTSGGDPFHRNRAAPRSTQTPEHGRHVGVARVVDPRAARDALRASSWEYAGRLRRTGQRIWSVMLGVSVSLSMTGGQLGKALSPRPVETLMDHLTSPYVIIGGFVPALIAVTAGQLVRNRYTDRAQAVERSVHDSYAAEVGSPPP